MNVLSEQNSADQVVAGFERLAGDFSLWVHRTAVKTPSLFWNGLIVTRFTQGISSTAVEIGSDPNSPTFKDNLVEFCTMPTIEDHMDRARVFVVVPISATERYLERLTSNRGGSAERGLVPGRFVMSHLLLGISYSENPFFDPLRVTTTAALSRVSA